MGSLFATIVQQEHEKKMQNFCICWGFLNLISRSTGEDLSASWTLDLMVSFKPQFLQQTTSIRMTTAHFSTACLCIISERLVASGTFVWISICGWEYFKHMASLIQSGIFPDLSRVGHREAHTTQRSQYSHKGTIIFNTHDSQTRIFSRMYIITQAEGYKNIWSIIFKQEYCQRYFPKIFKYNILEYFPLSHENE